MIHDEHPFATPDADRDPVRRFRGRLASPVTIVTAGAGRARAGLTVSSILVAEGDPSYVHCLIGQDTDVWDAIESTGAFVVHIVDEAQRVLSDVFAGIRPSPGGMFAGLEVADTEYGPVIESLGSRAFCRYDSHTSTAHHHVLTGHIERVELHDLRDPLQYFRGEYLLG